jgi:hypothetical protein
MPSEQWNVRPIGEPWLGFLADVDRALESSLTIHCIGGFALSTLVDMPRPTGDIDFIDVFPDEGDRLLTIAGPRSDLADLI